ncbi:2-oxoacid:ferredoxin oxidoreductase subunit alpha [Candidatus Bathyarchaeota archaeon ex4484_205]|nr:MAG: 2-oxoacid:ferredoxin oxidoreductase subunit alpha [Candidatus Bathyarchaeota archaeon ex4484_205]
MAVDELNFLIGGPQGAGLETTAQVLTFSLAHSGYWVISEREYHSNIRGRHSYIHFRVGRKRPLALTYPLDLLGAMDAETIFTHFKSLEENSYLVYDESSIDKTYKQIPSMEKHLKEILEMEIGEKTVGSIVEYLRSEKGVNTVGINFPKVLSRLSKEFDLSPSQASRYVSSILIGAVSGLMNLKEQSLRKALENRFGGRKKLMKQNLFLIKLVSDSVKEKHGTPIEMNPVRNQERELLVVSGNEIVAMGKLVAGVRYESYYPITPAADECFFLETLDLDSSLVVFQTEDEISAICSAIGAALTGTRSSTSTSGPGFSLMVEALGWAGMNEVPIVITYYQRGGPSTGQPTRGSQSDLLFSIFASHGEFPRIVLSSGDHLEAFKDSVMAFNLAEKYQVPVIHLLDKFLANSIVTMPIPELNLDITRGLVDEKTNAYKRFSLSENGISPRKFLGEEVMWYTGNEHDELGHVSENPDIRRKMYEKRMRKLRLMDKEISQEERAKYYGSEDADFLLVGWGSVKGVCLDAINHMNGAYLHVRFFSPFPRRRVSSILENFDSEKIIFVEHNYIGQLRKLFLMHRLNAGGSIVKYTGRPMYTNELMKGIKTILEKGKRKVVLELGP